jgi:hypothetical protein
MSEELLCPVHKAMKIHESCFGRDLGRSKKSQEGLLEFLRCFAASRYECLKHGMVCIFVLEKVGYDMRNIINFRTEMVLLFQEVYGFGKVASSILEKGGRSAKNGDDFLQKYGYSLTCPRRGYRDCNTA